MIWMEQRGWRKFTLLGANVANTHPGHKRCDPLYQRGWLIHPIGTYLRLKRSVLVQDVWKLSVLTEQGRFYSQDLELGFEAPGLGVG